MLVTVNGKAETVEPGTTVAGLVAGYALEPKHVAVEATVPEGTPRLY